MLLALWFGFWKWGYGTGGADDDVSAHPYFIKRYLDSLKKLQENIELESKQNNKLFAANTEGESPVKSLRRSKPPKAIPESFWGEIKAVGNDYSLVINKIMLEIDRLERELFENRRRDDELAILLLIS